MLTRGRFGRGDSGIGSTHTHFAKLESKGSLKLIFEKKEIKKQDEQPEHSASRASFFFFLLQLCSEQWERGLDDASLHHFTILEALDEASKPSLSPHSIPYTPSADHHRHKWLWRFETQTLAFITNPFCQIGSSISSSKSKLLPSSFVGAIFGWLQVKRSKLLCTAMVTGHLGDSQCTWPKMDDEVKQP